jgi:hypothetical protein
MKGTEQKDQSHGENNCAMGKLLPVNMEYSLILSNALRHFKHLITSIHLVSVMLWYILVCSHTKVFFYL